MSYIKNINIVDIIIVFIKLDLSPIKKEINIKVNAIKMFIDLFWLLGQTYDHKRHIKKRI